MARPRKAQRPNPAQQDLSSPAYARLDLILSCERNLRRAILDLRDATDEPDDRVFAEVVRRARHAGEAIEYHRADVARNPIKLGLGCEVHVRSSA